MARKHASGRSADETANSIFLWSGVAGGILGLIGYALRARLWTDPGLVNTLLDISDTLFKTVKLYSFAGDIPEGDYAQLMCANFDRLIQGAGEAAVSARGNVTPGCEPLAIAISCIGRRLVLGERTEEETEASLEVLPRGTRQIGFYSYGEISPYASGHCDLHNQTMTLTTIAEAA